jgi:hypothetical protein
VGRTYVLYARLRNVRPSEGKTHRETNTALSDKFDRSINRQPRRQLRILVEEHSTPTPRSHQAV